MEIWFTLAMLSIHEFQEKLLDKLESTELEPSTSEQDECVICITSRATMKTEPCKLQKEFYVNLIYTWIYC